MLRRAGSALLAFIALSQAISTAQLTPASQISVERKGTKASAKRRLSVVKVIPVPSEVATLFADPLDCDSDGNLYRQTDQFGVSGIHKLSPKGARSALFQAHSDSDLKVGSVDHFSVGTAIKNRRE